MVQNILTDRRLEQARECLRDAENSVTTSSKIEVVFRKRSYPKGDLIHAYT